MSKVRKTVEDIRAVFKRASLSDLERQAVLQDMIREQCPGIDAPALKPRQEPTRASKDKVKTLEELADVVAQWRAEGIEAVGVTSGVFDILHPGHISLLEDANRRCGKLIVIIASDRTVKAQKGDEKPYIPQLQRAQTIAALETADAVIISDEPYHETILKAIGADIMFKGDDYKDMEIKGAELVGSVVLIPCAEKIYNSSSAFVKKIKNSEP